MDHQKALRRRDGSSRWGHRFDAHPLALRPYDLHFGGTITKHEGPASFCDISI
jgi:hypothetical protein